MAHVFAVLLLLITPIDPSSLADDLFDKDNRFTSIIILRPQPPPQETTTRVFKVRRGGAHLDEKGIVGRPDGELKPERAKGAPRISSRKRQRDLDAVMDSPLMRLFSTGVDVNVSSVIGRGFGARFNEAVGRLRGTREGDAHGTSGWSTRGKGTGGGGKTLGIGGIGDGDGLDPKAVDLAGARWPTLGPVPRRNIVSKGCLSRATVGRTIEKFHRRARYCYEKELTRNPNLSGKVTTRFIIGPTGAVLSARVTSSTMGDASIEACLIKVVEQIRFPACGNGGSAQVTYPWVFSLSGGQ